MNVNQLNNKFNGGIQHLKGCDYQRTIRIGTKRTLWLFQDAFIGPNNKLTHNAAVLQEKETFTLLHKGTAANPLSWIAPHITANQQRWFWPLDGAVMANGRIGIFFMEMRERGETYLSHTEPITTWLAVLNPKTLETIRFDRTGGTHMFGWSVENTREWTYLYSHCHKQFGWGFLGHDNCCNSVFVARVPRGLLTKIPRYASKVSIAPNREGAQPMQIIKYRNNWISVTKKDDWWGDTLYFDKAPRPWGPWVEESSLVINPFDGDHNTYFASFIHGNQPAADSLIVGISNNRWDGTLSANYRPTFINVPLSAWGL